MTEDYFDMLRDDIKETINKFEIGKTQVSTDEKEELIKKAIEFYNEKDPIKDVFRYGNLCVFLIRTPAPMKDDEGKISNFPFQVPSNFGPEPNYMLKGVVFFHQGTLKFFSVFATMDQLKQIIGSTNKTDYFEKKALITGNLKVQYKLLEDEQDKKIKPMKANTFLNYIKKKDEYSHVKKISDVNENEIREYYSTNIIQVLYSK